MPLHYKEPNALQSSELVLASLWVTWSNTRQKAKWWFFFYYCADELGLYWMHRWPHYDFLLSDEAVCYHYHITEPIVTASVCCGHSINCVCHSSRRYCGDGDGHESDNTKYSLQVTIKTKSSILLLKRNAKRKWILIKNMWCSSIQQMLSLAFGLMLLDCFVFNANFN